MTGPGSPLEVWTLDDPIIAKGGVLLETVASEVCGTDVHIREGRLEGVPYPIIPGHVSVGRIIEANDVEIDALGNAVRLGDVVTFYDVHGVCHTCFFCAIARTPNRCPARRVYGITYSAHDGPFGGWAERIYLQPGVRIVKLPDSLHADDVIGGGCGLFTGFAAVERSDLAMGQTVVVQGVGPVGLSAVAFAALRGAAEIVAIGAPAERLELARLMGAETVLPLDSLTAVERVATIRDLTGGVGADVVIEASGNPEAVPEGFDMLRDGGTYVIAGHYTDAGQVAINPHVHINRKHADVRGHWGTEFHHLVRSLRLFAKHKERLPFRRIIGARYGLDRAGDALDDVGALRVTKAIIDPSISGVASGGRPKR